MALARPTVFTNQFRQTVNPGDPDLQINKSGVFSAVLGPSQTTPLVAGARVTLDSTNANATLPRVVGVADNTAAIGILLKTIQKSTFLPNLQGTGSIGDQVEVMFFAGPCIWQVAGGTINPGAQLECQSATIGSQVYPFFYTLNSNALAGIALDPAVQNSIFRMFLANALVS